MFDHFEDIRHYRVECRTLCNFTPFPTNVSLLYPLKKSENRFSDVFRGYRGGTLAENGLMVFLKIYQFQPCPFKALRMLRYN